MTIEQDPFGRPYRSGRLTDQQTVERMLQTGLDKVQQEGLRVSFDLLKFEDLIAEAGVARSAAYRKWPTKHHYYADLLRRLSGHVHPAVGAYDQSTIELALGLALEARGLLSSPQGRRALVVELCRQGSSRNFLTLSESPSWPIYVTLRATYMSLPEEGDLRQDIGKALASSEAWFVRRMSEFYEALIQAFGYRMRPQVEPVSRETLSVLGGALVEGLALMSVTGEYIAETFFEVDPFDTGLTEKWSFAALGFTSLVMALVEPDPEQHEDWGEDRVARSVEIIEHMLTRVESDEWKELD